MWWERQGIEEEEGGWPRPERLEEGDRRAQKDSGSKTCTPQTLPHPQACMAECANSLSMLGPFPLASPQAVSDMVTTSRSMSR